MNRKSICQRADTALERAKYDPRRLVAIYAGAVSILVLLIAIVNFALDSAIDTTNGLSGMGFRAVLSTAQTVLMYIQRIAVPFWGFGYTYCTLRILRGEDYSPKSLLMGFRLFLPLLCTVLLVVLYLTVGMIGLSYAVVMVLSLTPLANGMTDYAQQILASGGVMDEAMAAEVIVAARPLVIASTLICGLALFLFSYRFRMVIFSVLDDPKMGARYAHFKGRRMMKGHLKDLFLLDISFWWYYLASFLLVVVAYGDVILPLLGIELPMGNAVAFFLFYILYLVGQFALSVFAKNHVSVSYAVFYEDLKKEWEEPIIRF